MPVNAYSIIKPSFVVKERKQRNWMDDPIEDCFYFWNHSFTIKNNPSRILKRENESTPKHKRVCCMCSQMSHNTRVWVLEREGLNNLNRRICPSCYNAEMKRQQEIWGEDKAGDDYKRINALRDKLAECTKLGTCDILHAHHDLLQDDPERLTTEFMIGMVCGREGLEKYYNRS